MGEYCSLLCVHIDWGSKIAEISLAPYLQAYLCPTEIEWKYSEKGVLFE